MEHLHKKPSPSNEVLALLAIFMDNSFVHAVSFSVANTLKIFCGGLKNMCCQSTVKYFQECFFSVVQWQGDGLLFLF